MPSAPKTRSTFLLALFLCVTASATQAAVDAELLQGMAARSIGPAAVSGRISAIDAVIEDPNHIVIGAATGGVWVSTNGGLTWTPVFDDQPVASIGAVAINQANPDIIWTTSNPATTAEIMGGVYAQGLTAQWSGNSPSWNYQLLATDLGPVADAVYWHSTYTQLWETDDTPGMTAMVEGMRRLKPEAPLSDVYIISWTEGMATLAILEQAAANGDMTRAGIVKAFGEV